MAGSRTSGSRIRARFARLAAIAVMAALSLVVTPGTASAGGSVVPVLNCYAKGDKGAKTLVLGYTNSDTSARSIPQGSSNSVAPSRLQGSQPTRFEPGTVKGAYVIQLTEAELKQGAGWQLDGTWLRFDAAIGPASLCTDPIQLPADGNGIGTAVAVGAAGLLGAFVIVRFRRRLDSLPDRPAPVTTP